MTNGQKKITIEAMRTISAVAKKTLRDVEKGTTLAETSAGLEELRRIVNGVADAIGKAAGAENILSIARAKPLSSSR